MGRVSNAKRRSFKRKNVPTKLRNGEEAEQDDQHPMKKRAHLVEGGESEIGNYEEISEKTSNHKTSQVQCSRNASPSGQYNIASLRALASSALCSTDVRLEDKLHSGEDTPQCLNAKNKKIIITGKNMKIAENDNTLNPDFNYGNDKTGNDRNSEDMNNVDVKIFNTDHEANESGIIAQITNDSKSNNIKIEKESKSSASKNTCLYDCKSAEMDVNECSTQSVVEVEKMSLSEDLISRVQASSKGKEIPSQPEKLLSSNNKNVLLGNDVTDNHEERTTNSTECKKGSQNVIAFTNNSLRNKDLQSENPSVILSRNSEKVILMDKDVSAANQGNILKPIVQLNTLNTCVSDLEEVSGMIGDLTDSQLYTLMEDPLTQDGKCLKNQEQKQSGYKKDAESHINKLITDLTKINTMITRYRREIELTKQRRLQKQRSQSKNLNWF